ncbi:ADP-ribosyl cyclase/cyclic ADP-ribose hydrolase 2-like [Heterodontus francisci]|uniref:ADP-ribosyl cyclase/cyclic ADP-ribose hydrolase 2-like n=1 Tax=Heterodontus francisci TaxID=7792 RepID=UPI00355BEC13
MFFLNSLQLTGDGISGHNATKFRLLLYGLMLLSDTETTLAKDDTKAVWKGKGSTANLKEIMIGRCFNYIRVINPSAGNKDCSKLWEAFLCAFSKKDPCLITKDDYKPFLDLAGHDIPINQAIFWSQTKGLILQYTDVIEKVMPLENTLTGYMMNGLNWCGKLSSPEPNFEACPEWNDCKHNSVRSFWRAASEMYAKKAHGKVTVMLNGSAYDKAFREESIFSEIELENLDNKRVTTVNLWIMDNIDGPDKESCGVGSIAELEKILKEKNFKYSCQDNYKSVKMLQCVDKLDHPSCKLGVGPNV